jgi:hypothetical protein
MQHCIKLGMAGFILWKEKKVVVELTQLLLVLYGCPTNGLEITSH